MIERYFPFASHQVILLSTDEEVNHHYYEKLKPFVGHSYTLAYDENEGTSKIIPGYFGEKQ
jgi:DNA sulfur modification protein DndD